MSLFSAFYFSGAMFDCVTLHCYIKRESYLPLKNRKEEKKGVCVCVCVVVVCVAADLIMLRILLLIHCLAQSGYINSFSGSGIRQQYLAFIDRCVGRDEHEKRPVITRDLVYYRLHNSIQ